MSPSPTFRPGRFGLAVVLGVAMAASGFSGALADSAPSQDGVQHFLTCLDLMMTNGQQHAEQCGPNPYVPSDHPQLAPTMGGGPDCTIRPITMLEVPARGLQIASLGDGSEFLPHQQNQWTLMALPALDPCRPRCGSLTNPISSGVDVASLGDLNGLVPTLDLGKSMLLVGC